MPTAMMIVGSGSSSSLLLLLPLHCYLLPAIC